MIIKIFRGIEVVIGGIIRDGEGKILFVKSPKWNNKWIMPGGYIAPGETMAEAAIRECESETGLKLKPVALIDCNELINPEDFYRPVHFISLRWLLEVADQAKVKLKSNELVEYSWVKPEDALKMDMVKYYKPTVRRYLEFLRSEKK